MVYNSSVCSSCLPSARAFIPPGPRPQQFRAPSTPFYILLRKSWDCVDTFKSSRTGIETRLVQISRIIGGAVSLSPSFLKHKTIKLAFRRLAESYTSLHSDLPVAWILLNLSLNLAKLDVRRGVGCAIYFSRKYLRSPNEPSPFFAQFSRQCTNESIQEMGTSGVGRTDREGQ